MTDLKPARTNMTGGSIVDLDAIIAEPVYFKWNGKIHEIKPITVKEFLKYANANSKLLSSLQSDDKQPWETLASQYHSVIASVCDTISIDDVLKMEQPQVAALYQLIVDRITGTVDLGNGKKKTRLRLPIYKSMREALSRKDASSSGGPSKKFWSRLLAPISFFSATRGS